MFVHSNGLETLLDRITAQRVISRMEGQRPPLLPPRLVTAVSSASAGTAQPLRHWGNWWWCHSASSSSVVCTSVQQLKWKHITSYRLKNTFQISAPGKSFVNVYSSWYSALLNVSDFWNWMQNYPLNDRREVKCYSYSILGWLSFSCLQLYGFITAEPDLAATVSNEDKTYSNWRHTVSAPKIYVQRL